MTGTKEAYYYEKISRLEHQDLCLLWEKIKNKETSPEWPAGKALEYVLLRAFELEGAQVVYPYEVYRQSEVIEQIDGLIFWDNFIALVECKDVRKPTNFDPIAKLRNRLLMRPSQAIGCFFSMAGYTEPAKILAEHLPPQTILLWEKNDIDFSIKNKYFCKGLKLKFRECVKSGTPDFSLSINTTNE